MKRLALIALLAVVQRPSPDLVTFSVGGTVLRAGTAEGLPNVVVTLNPENGTPITVSTDEKGHFAFKSVNSGTLRISATRDGYLRPAKGGGLQTVNVGPNEDTKSLELSLVAGGAIAGTVVDATGQPMSGINVAALRLSYNEGRETSSFVPTLQGSPRGVTTDDRGQYRLFWLPPGNYYLRAETPPSVTAAAQPSMVSYFPGTLNANAATAVFVREGVEVGGINFKLEAADSSNFRKISGKVILPVGVLGSGIVGNFYLYPRDRETGIQGNGFTILSTNRGEDISGGNFTLRDVLPGIYDVIASLPSTANGQRTLSRASVTVGNKDIEGLTIPLQQTRDLKGRIIIDGPPDSIPLTPLSISITPDHHLQPFRANVEADGTFTVQGLPEGKYGVQIAGLPANAYVGDIRQDSRSIFASANTPGDAVIQVNADAVPIEMFVNSSGGTISVTVQDAKENAVPEATIALVPEFPRRPTLLWYKTGTTNTRGQLTLSGISPGDYKVFAWENMPPGAYQSADYLKDFETLGKRISVDSGSRLAMNVKVIPDDAQLARTFHTAIPLSPAPRDQVATAPSALLQGNNGIVEGTVKRMSNGDPIANVPVFIGNQSTRSGPDGHYIINNVPPGTYSLSMLNATSLGFYAPARDGVPGEVTLQPKQHIENLDFKLVGGGTITGRVTDANGQPLSGVRVQLESPNYVYGGRHLLIGEISGGVVSTDNLGEYRISRVKPGEYYLRARPNANGAPTWFPASLNLERSSPIVVKEDAELTQINMTIQPATNQKISGKIENFPVGNFQTSVSFYLVPRGDVVADVLDMLVQTVVNRQSGEFTINNVSPGSFDLTSIVTISKSSSAASLLQSPDSGYMSHVGVDIADQEITGLSLNLHPLAEMSGQFIFADGAKQFPLSSFTLYPTREDYGPSASWLISPIQLNADGRFTIHNVVDNRYTFSMGGGVPEDAYIADIRSGKSSALNSGIVVDGSSLPPVEIVVNTNGGKIDGVVEDKDRKPVAFARVVLIPEPSRRKNSRLYKLAVTDKNGHYSLHGITPGEYKVFSWESAPSQAWLNSEFLSPFEERGTPIHVEPSATVNSVVVKFIPEKTKE